MSLACRLPPQSDSPIRDLSAFVDCQASSMAHAPLAQMGHGLALPGLVTTALTLFVAGIGYRLMLGRGMSIHDLAMATLRVGLVLSLTMGWSAYDTLVYRVVTQGPLELVDQVMGEPNDRGDLNRRLYGRFQSLVHQADQLVLKSQDAAPSPGPTLPPSQWEARPTGKGPPPSTGQRQPEASTPQAGSGTFWDRPTRLVAMGSFGALLAIRVVLGALLGFGPVFIILALFDVTLGLFVGWLRSLIGSALALTGLTISCLLEINYFEAALAQASTGLSPSIQGMGVDPSLPTFVFLLTAVFFVITAFGVGLGLQIPPTIGGLGQDLAAAPFDLQPRSDHRPYPSDLAARQSPTDRIRSLSDAIQVQSRREALSGAVPVGVKGGSDDRRDGPSGSPSYGAALGPRRADMTFRSPSTIRRDGR